MLLLLLLLLLQGDDDQAPTANLHKLQLDTTCRSKDTKTFLYNLHPLIILKASSHVARAAAAMPAKITYHLGPADMWCLLASHTPPS
jgi:hypothetical protein